MQKELRHAIIHQLWKTHRQSLSQFNLIENALQKKNIHTLYLDHFAVIDLPSCHTGIPILRDMFTALGFTQRGNDYLSDKQNDFAWLAEINCDQRPAKEVLPQVVVADFRLDELPIEVKIIIENYAKQTKPSPLSHIQNLCAKLHGPSSKTELINLFVNYFQGRDWPLPTLKEFHMVKEFNELLAWVLINGRCPNHFTLSIHLLDQFNDLNHFHQFIESLGLTLNQDGGKIKGSAAVGIEQGSTIGLPKRVQLQDGAIELPGEFIEFVWRHPHDKNTQPQRWGDFFTDFIPQNANRVIESLYQKE